MLPPKLILAPVDFSDYSQDAARTAADLCSQFGGELLLVYAVPAIPTLPSATEIFREADYEAELRKEAERRLKALATELGAKGVSVRTEIGVANDVGMEILRIAEHRGVDLIVIATHGMTGWHRLVFGSVAEKVVRLAACPVLVLRAHPKSEHDGSGKVTQTAATR
jgi:nucleotide-binding universal stress UspA family protein